MDTDQKQICIATFRLTQRCALAPFDNRFIFPSVSVVGWTASFRFRA